ncbi:MAG: hypothetical protein COA78_30920 [Blastopirellula sp.]|nr:MAG: hypothetical protein COA78_30920 [Blastopirellula sp.]
MKQAIAGVSPSSVSETTSLIVWPSNGSSGMGRFLGKQYELELGISVFTLGNLIALLSIPIGLALFMVKFDPWFGIRYRISNRRILVERGHQGRVESSIDLDKFDSVEVQVQPGQAWYNAGDLVFLNGKTECYRLSGVSRPAVFREACVKANMTYVGIKAAKEREAAMA